MTARGKLSHNRVINLHPHPPPISDTERRLPRFTRTILAQLRSGWSNILNSYRARIITGTSYSCPSCNQAPHGMVHIFSCPAKPTDLRPMDLWLNHIMSDNIHTQLATNNLLLKHIPSPPKNTGIQPYSQNQN